jgi:hypothetical protein
MSAGKVRLWNFKNSHSFAIVKEPKSRPAKDELRNEWSPARLKKRDKN